MRFPSFKLGFEVFLHRPFFILFFFGMHFTAKNVSKEVTDLGLVKYVAELVLIGARKLVNVYKYFNFYKIRSSFRSRRWMLKTPWRDLQPSQTPPKRSFVFLPLFDMHGDFLYLQDESTYNLITVQYEHKM